MVLDHASSANVVPSSPTKLAQDLDQQLSLLLRDAAENSEFDLLNDLAVAIGESSAAGRRAERRWAEGLLELITASQRAGWQLGVQFPGGDARCFRRWLGTRLVLWPAALKGSALRGLVSSRLPRSLDTLPDWFCRLRSAVAETPPQELLMTVPQTAGVDFVGRAAELFGKRTIRVDCVQRQQPWYQWLWRCLHLAGRPANLLAPRTFVSPRLPVARLASGDAEVSHIPERDRVLVAGCDTLYALHVRHGGNVHQLLRARLRHQRPLAPHVRLAITDGMASGIRNDLMDAGAVGWAVSRPQTVTDELRLAKHEVCKSQRLPGWLREGHYLTHCTRRRQGPWPDQTPREYCDDLILQRAGADHSALATLQRIAHTRRLIATGDGLRGAARAVSFTSVPLEELHKLRVFRPHRGRWDFEPYGLCIEVGVLHGVGTHPVVYVDQTSGPTSTEALYQQKAKTTTRSGREIDWTVEREWRYHGDLDLTQIPRDAVCLFVPTPREAQQLQPEAPWPVLVLPADGT